VPAWRGDAADRYQDADISQLDFNARVLELAGDPTLPPAVRAGYLAIVASNLDEFFMVRIGALKRAAARAGESGASDAGGWSARLDGARLKARALHTQMYECLVGSLLPALAADGTRIRAWADLGPAEQARLTRRFLEDVRPRLVPLAASSHHPFPHVANSELAIAVLLRERASDQPHLATVSVPADLPRFLALDTPGEWMALESIVCAHITMLFPGLDVVRAHAFRVTRSADLRFDDATSTDLLHLVADAVERRPFLPVVRLEVERSMPPDLRSLLLQEFRFELPDRVSDLDAGDIVEVDGLAGLRGLREISNALHCALPLPARTPFPPGASTFETIRARDVLVHFPYDSFEQTVLRHLDEAAGDPHVEALTLTLYRTGDRSPVVDALFRARAAGKTVVVLVELKARFDEARNIESARALRAAGIQVVYGVADMKLHAKIALVLRRESGTLRRYAFIGSGNFNPATAALYTDVGLFTARESVCAEAAELVNALTGGSAPPVFKELLVAPGHMLSRLLDLIRREAEHARHGRPAGIRVKLNGLDEVELVDGLYEASAAGVPVALIVRGICTLRPGVAGLSERIRVVSVLGEFLEHARVIHVVNGGEDEYYIGSADWRGRNLRRRVEVVAPVVDGAGRSRLDEILRVQLADPGAWQLAPDGRWTRHAAANDPGGSQRRLIARMTPAERNAAALPDHV
jgi:polyphosphate kinase